MTHARSHACERDDQSLQTAQSAGVMAKSLACEASRDLHGISMNCQERERVRSTAIRARRGHFGLGVTHVMGKLGATHEAHVDA